MTQRRDLCKNHETVENGFAAAQNLFRFKSHKAKMCWKTKNWFRLWQCKKSLIRCLRTIFNGYVKLPEVRLLFEILFDRCRQKVAKKQTSVIDRIISTEEVCYDCISDRRF